MNIEKEFIPYEQAELECLRKLIEICNSTGEFQVVLTVYLYDYVKFNITEL